MATATKTNNKIRAKAGETPRRKKDRIACQETMDRIDEREAEDFEKYDFDEFEASVIRSLYKAQREAAYEFLFLPDSPHADGYKERVATLAADRLKMKQRCLKRTKLKAA